MYSRREGVATFMVPVMLGQSMMGLVHLNTKSVGGILWVAFFALMSFWIGPGLYLVGRRKGWPRPDNNLPRPLPRHERVVVPLLTVCTVVVSALLGSEMYTLLRGPDPWAIKALAAAGLVAYSTLLGLQVRWVAVWLQDYRQFGIAPQVKATDHETSA